MSEKRFMTAWNFNHSPDSLNLLVGKLVSLDLPEGFARIFEQGVPGGKSLGVQSEDVFVFLRWEASDEPYGQYVVHILHPEHGLLQKIIADKNSVTGFRLVEGEVA